MPIEVEHVFPAPSAAPVVVEPGEDGQHRCPHCGQEVGPTPIGEVLRQLASDSRPPE
jgi:hypothetical protein